MIAFLVLFAAAVLLLVVNALQWLGRHDEDCES